ncbi:MAG TPA: hypothetical protein P5117_01830 [Spirochaetia bacterium]|nr:hypothetical protein [Spirochaetales bacterium]HRY78896.1 hypothetical protein [Spirochaetia bacterium]HRZ88198.1 hypothetical protein [Spirochaetia bacterium]
MKRFALTALILALALAPAAAQGIDLGNFPLGSWLDANYDAVWEFSSGNIRILSPAGDVLFDFGAAGVQNFKVGAGGDGPFITFACEAAGRTYKITKPLTKSSAVLEIQRPNLADYKVEMPKK